MPKTDIGTFHSNYLSSNISTIHSESNTTSVSVYSAMKIRPKEQEVYFDVVAIVDPVTRDAQKLAPLLLVSTPAFHSLT